MEHDNSKKPDPPVNIWVAVFFVICAGMVLAALALII